MSDPAMHDGAQDERPFVRCSACQKLLKCYRGPLIKEVDDGAGNVWQHFAWVCSTCLSEMVGEALRQAEPPE